MDADDDKQHQSSSSIMKQSIPKLIIKFAGRNIIQQQCSSSKEAEEVVIKNISVSKNNLSISNNNSPKSISNNSDSSLYLTCSICGKSFPSKQSLFGHLRSHPDREWRGSQPPPSSSSSPLDQSQSLSVRVLIKNSPASTGSDDSRKSVESDSSYQGVGPLPVHWSGTGKRGRRSYYGSFLSSDERIADAVKGLLMLKEGNDLDAALMNKQVSRKTESVTIPKKKKKKKRVILESSSSEDVSRSSDLLRSSSKKIKIDQERSCSSSRDGFDPKLMINNIHESSQLEQLPAASNMFQRDCGLVKEEYSKNVKLAEDCGFDPKLMNSIQSSPSNLEQLPAGFHGDFRLVKNSPKKVKLDERGCGGSRDQFDPKPINSIPSSSHVEQIPTSHLEQMYSKMPTSHLEQMYSNGFHGGCSSYVEQPPNGYFQGMFNSVFLKPAILMKATPNKKKVKEIEKGLSDMEFKCDTCHRTFPSHQALGGHKSSQRNCKNGNSSNNQFPIHHDHQYQYLQCRESLFQAAEQEYITKTPTMTSYVGGSGTHTCEVCGLTFVTGQALGGHKRRHYIGHFPGGGLNTTFGTVPVNSTTAMAQTEKLIKKEEVNRLSVVAVASAVGEEAQTEKLNKKEEMNSLSVVAVASPVGEEMISTTAATTTATKTENKPVLDFDLNEMPDETQDDESWR